MKKVLVVDESQAVRETLSLVLGRDFIVVQRPFVAKNLLPYPDEEVDLLILGLSPSLGLEASTLLEFASQLPFPVLFLVDSQYTLRLQPEQRSLDCLAKPFNPYALRETVARLLTRGRIPLEPLQTPFDRARSRQFLEFPYLSLFTAAQAKKFALTSLPILVVGEVGCGQDRVARGIYSLSDNAGPWITAYRHEINKDYLLRRMAELSRRSAQQMRRITVFLDGVDTLGPSAQSSLLSFLEEDGRGRDLWVLSSSRVDLLKKVYEGEFLDALYYRLATLTLKLAPLRDRVEDIPELSARVAREYGTALGLGQVTLGSDAVDRLKNYLWFGNLGELESVLAQTLAVHRKEFIRAEDLLLGIEDPGTIQEDSPVSGGGPSREERRGEVMELVEEFKEDRKESPTISPEPGERRREQILHWANGDFPDLKVLINELAHELKNPMVTIKTFAQLLAERFDDATFRIRFQETVGGDIERMDDLLESLLDFSRFSHPVMERILLHEQLRQILEEIAPECIKRAATVRWGRKGENGEVFADSDQLRYAFKNILRTVLAESKPSGEIQIDVEQEGKVAVSYTREGGRMSSVAEFLDLSRLGLDKESVPLRILLAKIVLERNGGAIAVNHLDEERVLIRIELPVP